MIFVGIGLFGIGIIIFALMLLLRGDGSREQKLMQYFLLGALVQNVGYLLELTSPTLEAAIVSVKMQYLGSLTIPISYCHFIFSYCCEKAPKKILSALKIVDIVVIGLVFTCDLHNIYYRSIQWVETTKGYGFLSLEYGPGYWTFMVCGTAIPYVLSLYALIRFCIKRPEYAADRRCGLILVLSFLPVLSLYVYSTKIIQIYDFTPVVLGLVLSSVVILIWIRKVYDFSSLAFGILLNSMSDSVIALDEQRQITNYNPAATRIFKDLNSQMIGEPIELLKGFPKDMLGEKEKWEFCLNDRFYQGHVEPILDEFRKNKGYVVLLFDVTETRNYIEEIKRVREQAEQANIAKSAFLANMSHEIRTPMNAIVGLSDIIMEESRGRKVYEYACDIKSASRNLLALINDILDLSKVEAGKMELVPTEYHVISLADEVLSMMEVVASQRGLCLKKEYDMSIPCCYLGDEGRIKQILINILNNALKFTKKGYVAFSVTARQGDREDLEILSFRIEDTGCGIREENLKEIFDNFKQVDSRRNRAVEGTGLGLSITKRLIDLMQGTIQVESVYGKGTTFTIEIPQKIVDNRPLSEVPAVEKQKEEILNRFTVKDCRVLVVDDNRVNRKVAATFLKTYGLEIDEAESGVAAIALVHKTLYDIIFMDHMMPEMDGIETVQRIRSQCGDNGKKPIIIALTANAMEGVREIFLNNGFQDFITKPLDRQSLHTVLLKWISEEKRIKEETSIEADNTVENDTVESQVKIEGIEIEEILERYPDGLEDYFALLDLYCLDGKRKQIVLRELWEKHDYKNYGIEVHGLKSASANVGAMAISRSAKEQEMAVDRGDIAYVDAHAEQLLMAYATQIDYISQFLNNVRQPAHLGEKVQAIDYESFVAEINKALNSLENFRAKDCAHKIEEILQYQISSEVESRLIEVQEQLKLYEDEAAEQMLRELLEIV
ncbi:autoinducer 2 sensor kinase/phosphatase LuxQ [Lachnospiraceae bacterium]|nr:autoinducer 2 sensor kinase/phosphatase LuxQ [Lachnospiraceae bacterium]